MELDDELCLCFHVTQRKVVNFIRVERPSRVAQLSECFGAGTGCGWCRPFLRRLFEQSRSEAVGSGLPNTVAEPELNPENLSAVEYARQRSQYVRAGGGTLPPGATPIEEG